MRVGLRIIDADRHVIEPFDMWQRYLEPAFVARAPTTVPATVTEPVVDRVARLGALGLLQLPPVAMFEGKPIFGNLSEQALLALAAVAHARGGRTGALDQPETYLQDMDQQGIELCFLYPTFTLLMLTHEHLEPPFARAIARAYNTWLRDFCARDPQRLRGVGVLSLHEPEQLVPQLQDIVALGWRTVMVRPNPFQGRLLGAPEYAAFWAECERLSVSVALHEGTHSHGVATGSDRFHTRFAQHACSHPMEHMMGFLSLLEGGVLERHPKLRFAFLESGCGWVPYWLWRLDEEYRLLAGEVRPHVRLKPSEYFRRQCFVVAEPSEKYLTALLPQLGEDLVLFGSDFPHLDHEEGELEELLALREQFPEPRTLQRMLWDNPARFYGVEER
jgi:predicted TIM-barrel fold metal-dependent hydrolase